MSRRSVKNGLIKLNLLIIVIALSTLSVFSSMFIFFTVKNNLIHSIDTLSDQTTKMLNSYFSNINTLSKSVFYSKDFQRDWDSCVYDEDGEAYERCSNTINQTLLLDSSLFGIHFFNDKMDLFALQAYDVDFYLANLKGKIMECLSDDVEMGPLKTLNVVFENKMLSVISCYRVVERIYADTGISGIGVFYLNREKIRAMVDVGKYENYLSYVLMDENNNIIISDDTAQEGKIFDYSKINDNSYVANKIGFVNWTMAISVDQSAILKEVFLGIIVVILICVFIIGMTIFFSLQMNRNWAKAIAYLQKTYLECDIRTEKENKKMSEDLYDMADDFKLLIERNEKKQREIYEIELEKKSYELKALAFQINSHFLFNTMASMRALIKMNENEHAIMALDNLVEYLRYSLKKGDFVALKDEVAYLNAYIEMIKLRFGQKYVFEINLPKELESKEIAKMIIQPLVENVLHHAFEQQDRGRCEIVFSEENNFLKVSVSDDGQGMSEDDINQLNDSLRQNGNWIFDGNEKSNIGLQNIGRRIKLFYGEESFIQVRRNSPQGLIIELFLKFKQVKND